MNIQDRCLKAIWAFHEELRARGEGELSEEDVRALCERMLPYLAEEMNEKKIREVLANYFAEGPMVEAMLDPLDPDHGMYWSEFYLWCQSVSATLIPDASEREDFLQDLFFHFQRKLDKYRFQKPLQNWAFTVIRNFLRDRYRRQQRRKTISLDDFQESLPTVRPSAQEMVEQKERAVLLERMLEKLISDRDLLILRLTLQKGEGGKKMTDMDIARAVGLSPSSISKTRGRILERLRNDPDLRALVAALFGEDYLQDEGE